MFCGKSFEEFPNDNEIDDNNERFDFGNIYGLFICLFEKVIAKIHGGYNKIKWGYSSTIYKMLTSFNSAQLEMQEMIKMKFFYELIDYLKT